MRGEHAGKLIDRTKLGEYDKRLPSDMLELGHFPTTQTSNRVELNTHPDYPLQVWDGTTRYLVVTNVGTLRGNPAGTVYPEMGDTTYPFQITDGSSVYFSSDTSGNIVSNSLTFGSASVLSSQDKITLPTIAGYATPARVQSVTANGTSTTPTAGAWSPATTLNNLLIMVVSWRSGATVSVAPGGIWTLATAVVANGSTVSTAIYYGVGAGADAAPSLTLSASAAWRVHTFEYSGIATSSPLDKEATATGATGGLTGDTGQTATTTQSYELWFGAIGLSSDDESFSNPTKGFAEVTDAHALGTWQKVVTGTGKAQTKPTVNGAVFYAGKMVTFKAKSLGTVTTTSGTGDYFVKAINTKTAPTFQSDSGTSYYLHAGGLTSITTPVNVDGTGTNTTIISTSIPANTMQAGTTFRIRIFAQWGTKAAPVGAATFTIVMGSTTILSHAPTLSAGLGGTANSETTWYVTVNSTGAAATHETNGTFFSGGAIASPFMDHQRQSTGTFDTTAVNALTLKFQWTTSNSSNTCHVKAATIEFVVP